MNKKTYEGWANKETWSYSLDMFNDDLSYRYWHHKAALVQHEEGAVDILAQDLRAYALSEAEDTSCPFVGDLLAYSIERIDFQELAERLLEKVKANFLAFLH